jgi:hypothetical protein
VSRPREEPPSSPTCWVSPWVVSALGSPPKRPSHHPLPSSRRMPHRRPTPVSAQSNHHLHWLHPCIAPLHDYFAGHLNPSTGPAPPTYSRPSAPSWRATHGESPTAPPPQIKCPPSRQAPRPAPPPVSLSAGRISPASRRRRGRNPLPYFPGWAKMAEGVGPFGRVGRVLRWTEPKCTVIFRNFQLN